MALFGFELEEIARLLALVDAQGLDEFIYEEEGRYLRVRGPRGRKNAASSKETSGEFSSAPSANAQTAPERPVRAALPRPSHCPGNSRR